MSRTETFQADLLEKYRNAVMRPWQRAALDKLRDQPERKFLWVWSSHGKAGKSWLGRYLAAHGAFVCVGGRHADINYAYDLQKTVVFDLSRAQRDRVPWPVLEGFLNGFVFSSKYDSHAKMMDPCLVIVFSNYPPSREDERGEPPISLDRYVVMEICLPQSGIGDETNTVVEG